MKSFLDIEFDKGYYSPANPVKEFVTCCTETLVSCEQESEISELNDRLKYICHEVPLIFIGMDTSGLASGAGKTKSAIEEVLIKNNIDAKVICTGGIDFGAIEPVVDIKFPGEDRIIYGEINAKEVPEFIKTVLIDKEIYEKQQEFISRSHIRIQSLLDLVNDLLDISRMELKTKRREIQLLNIIETLYSVIELVELEIKKRGLHLNVTSGGAISPVKADTSEITCVFTNVLSNAIKYNKDNGSIEISVYEKGSYVIITFKDTGIGMQPEEKEKLSQEFTGQKTNSPEA